MSNEDVPAHRKPKRQRDGFDQWGYGAVERTGTEFGEDPTFANAPGTTSPPAGFYADPVDGEGLRFWDGTRWTEHEKDRDTQPAPPAPGSTPVSNFLGAGGTLEQVQEEAGQYYQRNKDTVHKVGGAALVADGLIGFGRNREGLGGAIGRVFFGLLFAGMGLLFFFLMSSSTGSVDSPVDAQAVVTSSSPSGSSSASCSLQYEYTVNGQTFQGRPGFASSTFCEYSPGTSVNIVYDANNPQKSSINETSTNLIKFFPLIFVALGVFFAVSGVWTTALRLTQIVGGSVLFLKARKKK